MSVQPTVSFRVIPESMKQKQSRRCSFSLSIVLRSASHCLTQQGDAWAVLSQHFIVEVVSEADPLQTSTYAPALCVRPCVCACLSSTLHCLTYCLSSRLLHCWVHEVSASVAVWNSIFETHAHTHTEVFSLVLFWISKCVSLSSVIM